MKILSIATSTIRYSGPDKLDITIKSATGVGTVLAPTWGLVRAVKEHVITPQEYSDQYHSLLRQRYMSPAWLSSFFNIINRGHLVLTCYCRPGKFCHRHLAAAVITKIAVKHGFEVFQEGEIT